MYKEKMKRKENMKKDSNTWNLIEITAPQISSPTINCSPKIANI
jgi:hypothetical protein